MMAELKLDHVSKRYSDKAAVNDMTLSLHEGVYGLLGANGAGKTTLMRMLCGILDPSAGTIRCGGMDIARLGEDYRALLGYLPQDFGCYPDFTAQEFLLYIASLKGMDRKGALHRAEELLVQVGLTETAKRKIRTFSGGMKQRLGIAQAMLNDPQLLILDEPTAGLDPVGRSEILGNIQSYRKAKNATIMMVSHSMEDVARLTDRLLVMNGSKLAMDAPPAQVFTHAEELTQMGLNIPQVTQVFLELKKLGLDVKNVYTIDQAAAEIRRLKGGNCHA